MESLTYQFFVTAFTGAVAATVLNILYQRYMNRPQGIGINVDASPILSTLFLDKISVKVTVKDQNTAVEFDNLYAATIDIENISNKDNEEFEFSVDFTGGDLAIYAEGSGKNRRQQIIALNSPGISNPTEQLDFVCKPFNRRDKYTVKTLITVPQGSRSRNDIKLLFDGKYRAIEQGTYGS